jgi:enamine deaminase RidA (YjgF/YER057c/UK114 family)
MNAVYAKFFPDKQPARTTVGCTLLGIDVEMDAIVKLP